MVHGLLVRCASQEVLHHANPAAGSHHLAAAAVAALDEVAQFWVALLGELGFESAGLASASKALRVNLGKISHLFILRWGQGWSVAFLARSEIFEIKRRYRLRSIFRLA